MAPIESVTVSPEPPQPPYTVTVGAGVLGQLSVPGRVALIYPEDLPPQWLQQAQTSLQPHVALRVPARDGCKTLAVYTDLLSQLAQAGLTRQDAVVGLGGGAVTDLAGFLAASYLRGVSFYTVPTTLLGMVDAAVGGKTGLNLPEGKNLVGAFWSPLHVWCDVNTLATLPPQTFREGAAEVFKHSLIADPALQERVLDPAFGPSDPQLTATVAAAIRVKADIVSRDPREKGERAFLNYGHTLAHALEAWSGGRLAHGDAVGYGLHYAALLGRALGLADVTARTAAFLAWQQPQPLPPLSFEALQPYLARDKKADLGGVRWVLLREPGQPTLQHVPLAVLREAFRQWQADVYDGSNALS